MNYLFLKNLLEYQKDTFGDEIYEKFEILDTFSLNKREDDVSSISNNKNKLNDNSQTKEETYEKFITKKESEVEQDLLLNSKKSNKEEFNLSKNLEDLYVKIHQCQNCPLGLNRNKFVFGKGNAKADIMLIGEAPGAEEDLRGEPFVGKAGELLTKILAAINLKREEVFIANIVKCRPPNNRNPLPEEINKCLPYLLKQIELIKPKFILCLGLIAANSLLNKKQTLSFYRGKVFEFNGANVMVTFHPAALLRNPSWKKDCWEDVKKFRSLYDEYLQNKKIKNG
jgi:uracil-DNA glycosylase family 4